HILPFLPVNDIVNRIGLVCKRFYRLCNNPNLWKQIYLSKCSTKKELNWKKMYIKKFGKKGIWNRFKYNTKIPKKFNISTSMFKFNNNIMCQVLNDSTVLLWDIYREKKLFSMNTKK